METVLRRGPLQWGMAWSAWLTYQIDRKAEYPSLNFEYELPGGTSPRTVKSAVAALIERHEVLRTTFGADECGLPQQTVWSPEPVTLHQLDRVRDPAGVDAFKDLDFAIDTAWPCRFAVVSDGDGTFSLLACFAHIAVDGHARDILKQDFAEILESARGNRAPDLQPLAYQPLDHAAYELSEATNRLRERAKQYWQDQLDRIPIDAFGIAEAPESTRYVNCSLRSRPVAGQLERIASGIGVPMSAVFSAVFLVALHTATARDVLPLSIASHGRVTANALDVVAALSREVIMPVELKADQSFDDLARTIHRLTFEAVRYSMVNPLEFSEWKAIAGSRKGGEIGSRISLNFVYNQRFRRTTGDAAWQCTLSDATEYRSSSHHLYVGANVQADAVELIVSGSEAALGRSTVEALARSITDLLGRLDGPSRFSLADLRRAVSSLFPAVVPQSTARFAALGGASGAVAALAHCARQANGLELVDTGLSYVEAGGRFVRIPAVLSLLKERGYEGLEWNDFQLPCSLSVLSTRLSFDTEPCRRTGPRRR